MEMDVDRSTGRLTAATEGVLAPLRTTFAFKSTSHPTVS